MSPTPRPLVALVLGASLLLAACNGGGDGDGATAEERLQQAHDVAVEAGTLHLSLTGTDLPEDTSTYIISAEGDGTMDPPAFTGTITAKLAGVQADVPTVAVDGDLWVKLPFAPKHVKTDPAALNVPDPASLLDPESGLVALLPQTEDPQFGERLREGAETVQQVTGSLPGEAVTSLLLVGDGGATFDVVYGLVEESWELRTVDITGPFYPPATSTYSLTLDAYGAPVTVTAP